MAQKAIHSESQKHASIWSAAVTAMLAVICLAWWLAYDPTADFAIHVPGMDHAPVIPGSAGHAEVIRIGEFFDSFDGRESTLPGSWPRFRGENFDNINTEKVPLANSWPAGGPEVLWSVALGEGHAAPVVFDGRVYLLDYDEENKADALRCFSLADGREIWRRWYQVRVKRNHGMSRTIPAVTGRYVVTIGPRCQVMCADSRSGDFIWGIDLEKEYGTETPLWYTGQCPLIDDSLAVIAPAGTSLLIGVDCASGKVVWKTPNPSGWQMSHSSVMPMTLNGRKMYVYCAIGGMAGVSAEGADAGQVLWETTAFTSSVIAPSPVIFDDGRIFMTAGYGAGGMMLKVSEAGGHYSVQKLLEYKSADGLASEQQTPVLYQGFLFSIQPKDAGILRNQLVCYHPDDCTQLIWASGKTNRFGLGPFLFADDKMFVLSDDGVLTLLEASTSAYQPLAQAKVLDGHDAWGPMALAGGRLLVRDSKEMRCLDVGAGRSTGQKNLEAHNSRNRTRMTRMTRISAD